MIFGLITLLLVMGFLLINGLLAYQATLADGTWTTLFKYQFYFIPLFFLANVMVSSAFRLGFQQYGNLTWVGIFSKWIDMLAVLAIAFLFLQEQFNWKIAVGVLFMVIGVAIIGMARN